MAGRARRVRNGRDALVLARAVLSLRALDGSLRRLGFAATHEKAHRAVADGSEQSSEQNRPDIAEAEHLAALVSLAARIARVRCLPRALLLYTWLGRGGAPVRLCIGVRREGSTLRAHAWVEWTLPDGESRPLGEPSNVRGDFAVLRGGLAPEGGELETSDFAEA
jgi:hypothetical protein